jgi:hypothetical protein
MPKKEIRSRRINICQFRQINKGTQSIRLCAFHKTILTKTFDKRRTAYSTFWFDQV